MNLFLSFVGIFATQSSVNQSNNLKHRQFIHSLVKLEFTWHFGVASQLFLGFLKNCLRQSERVRVRRREWDLWEAWWRLILIELLRRARGLEGRERLRKWTRLFHYSPSGAKWGEAGLLVGESMQLMPIIEEDVGGGGGAVQHVGGGRALGSWLVERRTGGCSEQLTAARDTWAEASCRTGLPIPNNNKTHFLCCERKRETRRLTL